MRKKNSKKSMRLELKDYFAIVIAALESTLAPFLIFILVLALILLYLGIASR